mgnify:CR=1 FL=1
MADPTAPEPSKTTEELVAETDFQDLQDLIPEKAEESFAGLHQESYAPTPETQSAELEQLQKEIMPAAYQPAARGAA